MSRANEQRKPPWRQAVDGIDRLITPQVNTVVRTNVFADILAITTRLEVQLRRRIERQTTWAWHLWNLPTAGDIRRLRAQVSALEGRVRDVSERLDDHQPIVGLDRDEDRQPSEADG